MDVFTPQKRSVIMARISGKNTAPEITVRRILHKLGFRFRTHVAKIPGKPDIVLRKHRTVIFVHGCFWHGHSCKRGHLPTSNVAFWRQKIGRNIRRDKVLIRKLKTLGWRVLIIWQCRTQKNLQGRLIRFLGAPTRCLKPAKANPTKSRKKTAAKRKSANS
jgi:DNA mismatch endonuclease, patch repair protein